MPLLAKTLVIALMPLWLASAAVLAGQPAAAATQAATGQASAQQPQPTPDPSEPENNAEPEPQAEPADNPEPAQLPAAGPEPEPRQNLAFQRQEPASERSNGSGISLGKIAISLAAVLLLVVVLGWLFKKLTMRLPGNQHIKVICSVPLGQRERLLVVEIQGKQRVLGVTQQSINMLFELETSLPETKLASDFHTQLQSFLKK